MNSRQALVQANMENYWKLTSKTSFINFSSSDNAVKAVSSVPEALLNSVLSVKLNNINVENTVVDLESFYAKMDKSFCWWVFPNQDAMKLSYALESHNFNYEGVVEGMVLPELSKLDFEYGLPENVEIRSAAAASCIDDWMQPIIASFGLSEAGADSYKSIFKALIQKTDEVEHYIAYQSEKPVSSCSVFLDKASNTAGIYNCATIAAARKQGLCSALMRHGLFNAKQRGFKTAVLQASDFSKKLFEKAGFEACTPYKLYCK